MEVIWDVTVTGLLLWGLVALARGGYRKLHKN